MRLQSKTADLRGATLHRPIGHCQQHIGAGPRHEFGEPARSLAPARLHANRQSVRSAARVICAARAAVA